MPKSFSQALEKAGIRKEDLVLLNTEERIMAVRHIAAEWFKYSSAEKLLLEAPLAVIERWRYLCGYIGMMDADISEEVAIRLLYDAWKEDPTTERLQDILDHILTEKNQGRYFGVVTKKNGETYINRQPPFYMLNGFFSAIYAGKKTMESVISIFRHDVDWQAGTVRKTAELYGSAISTVMRERNMLLNRIGKELETVQNEEREAELEAEHNAIESLTDKKMAQLEDLYAKAGRINTTVFYRQKERILGRARKEENPKLNSDVILYIERIVPVSPGLPTEVYLDDKQIQVGGYKEVKLLIPLNKDGTELPIYGMGYLDQLKGLIEQFNLTKGKEE